MAVHVTMRPYVCEWENKNNENVFCSSVLREVLGIDFDTQLEILRLFDKTKISENTGNDCEIKKNINELNERATEIVSNIVLSIRDEDEKCKMLDKIKNVDETTLSSMRIPLIDIMNWTEIFVGRLVFSGEYLIEGMKHFNDTMETAKSLVTLMKDRNTLDNKMIWCQQYLDRILEKAPAILVEEFNARNEQDIRKFIIKGIVVCTLMEFRNKLLEKICEFFMKNKKQKVRTVDPWGKMI